MLESSIEISEEQILLPLSPTILIITNIGIISECAGAGCQVCEEVQGEEPGWQHQEHCESHQEYSQ